MSIKLDSSQVNSAKQIAENQAIWNLRADSHLQSEFYDHASFLAGRSSLNQYELDLLGDVDGKSLLHLQCHFGQDTLSLQRSGAMCTGVDFAQKSIDIARQANEQLGLAADFHCCNVYDTATLVKRTFDIVFTSYGVIGWLPDLDPWAKVINDSLSSGGMFVMCEFHPFVWMMDEAVETIKYSYFNDGVIETNISGSYACGDGLHEPRTEFGWNHSLSEVMTALLSQGLVLENFQEFDGSPYNCFPNMDQDGNGLFRFNKWGKMLPLVYGLRFRKL